MDNKIYFEIENKVANKWTSQYIHNENSEAVYQKLSHDLIAKKINQCSYIKSIKRVPLYNGYQKIIVTYDNKVRCIYQIESH